MSYVYNVGDGVINKYINSLNFSIMKRNETKYLVKTINHTIEYPFGINKTKKTINVTLNIIKHTYEEYIVSSTHTKGYTKQYKTLIQTEDKTFSIHTDEETIKGKYLDHDIIVSVTESYYNDTVDTYFAKKTLVY